MLYEMQLNKLWTFNKQSCKFFNNYLLVNFFLKKRAVKVMTAVLGTVILYYKNKKLCNCDANS